MSDPQLTPASPEFFVLDEDSIPQSQVERVAKTLNHFIINMEGPSGDTLAHYFFPDGSEITESDEGTRVRLVGHVAGLGPVEDLEKSRIPISVEDIGMPSQLQTTIPRAPGRLGRMYKSIVKPEIVDPLLPVVIRTGDLETEQKKHFS